MPKRSLIAAAVMSAFLMGSAGFSDGAVFHGLLPSFVAKATAAPVEDNDRPRGSFAGEDGAEYRFDAAAQEQENVKKTLKFEENQWAGYFDNIAQDIADQSKKITEEAQKRGQFEKDRLKAANEAWEAVGACGKDEDCIEAAKKKATDLEFGATYMDYVSKDGDTSKDALINSAAQFAADMIHATGSLTREEFEEDSKEIAAMLNKETARMPTIRTAS